MRRTLLLIGGVSQVAFGLFHLWLSKKIHSLQAIPSEVRATMQALNVGGTMLLFFCAYVSSFRRDELLSTGLGKATLTFISLFYFVRAVEDIILFDFNPIIFVMCLVVGGIYLGTLVLSAWDGG